MRLAAPLGLMRLFWRYLKQYRLDGSVIVLFTFTFAESLAVLGAIPSFVMLTRMALADTGAAAALDGATARQIDGWCDGCRAIWTTSDMTAISAFANVMICG